MIQYGMRAHDICKKSGMEKVFDSAASLGIRYLQLAMGKSFSEPDTGFGHFSDGLCDRIRSELAARGLHVSVLGSYINPANPNEEKRLSELERFIEMLKYAKGIGADLVGTETGRFSEDFRVTEETETERCYETMLDSFLRIRQAAEKLGVRVGIEGVYNHTLSNPQKIERFLQDIDSPNFDIILDGVNIITPESKGKPEEQNRIIRECFERFGSRISVIHLKDGDFTEGREQIFCRPGKGVFCYEELMRQLSLKKPCIVGILENSSPESFREDCDYLEEQYQRYRADKTK